MQQLSLLRRIMIRILGISGSLRASVIEFRRELQKCDGVLISSPEYAHGVPGVLKNALDWIVGSGELTRFLPA